MNQKQSFKDYVYTTEEATSALLVLVTTGLIFLMQAGFAMVEVGSVRQKNVNNILIKNIFDTVAGALAFWLVGYGFAFG
jgi:ammonium transporter, Amt family